MKKVISVLAVILLLPSAYSQDATVTANTNTGGGKKNIIKTSLIFPFMEALDISYERVAGKDISLVLEIMTGNGIFMVSPQLRYYLSENMTVPSGTFISPLVLVGNETGGAGIMVGRQRVFKDKISLDAYIGPAYYTEGVAVWGGINVGIAF